MRFDLKNWTTYSISRNACDRQRTPSRDARSLGVIDLLQTVPLLLVGSTESGRVGWIVPTHQRSSRREERGPHDPEEIDPAV